MSRHLQCGGCGFYASFGHGGFPIIRIQDMSPKDIIETGNEDPFYVYHTACPRCGLPFHVWASDEDDRLFLPFNKFVQKLGEYEVKIHSLRGKANE